MHKVLGRLSNIRSVTAILLSTYGWCSIKLIAMGRHQYLDPINRAYQEHFSDMDEYKKENTFKRLLTKLTLEDVCTAINRADRIMERNRENGWPEQPFCGYTYYTVNPSLSIGEVVKSIFKQCKIPPYDR